MGVAANTVRTVLVGFIRNLRRAVLMVQRCMVTYFTDILRGIHVVGPGIITHYPNA